MLRYLLAGASLAERSSVELERDGEKQRVPARLQQQSGLFIACAFKP